MNRNHTAKPLLILGAGTFAVEVADLASDIPGIRVAGFVESLDRSRCAETIQGLPVHWVDEIGHLAESHSAICAIGSTHRRTFIERVAALGTPFIKLIHPTARVSLTSSVGEGSIISVGAVIASHVGLGRHVIANRGALIGHHTDIGDYVTIGPGANIAGGCRIAAGVYLGIGATLVDNKSVGAGSIVGAGALVTKDVSSNVLVAGAPARIAKKDVDGK